jgi:hypothetical protein
MRLVRCATSALLGALFLLSGGSVIAGDPHVRPLFDPRHPTIGPFPTDLLTVEDATQNTGRRINLPLKVADGGPNCSVEVSECQDRAVLNQLDGFGLQTRLSVPFDGDIDTDSVSSDTVFVVDLGGTLPTDPPATGAKIGINQAVWDATTHTLHVEVDQELDQHRRYGLIVAGITATDGSHLKTNGDFVDFLDHGEPEWYRDELNAAVNAARDLGVKTSDIAVASVFTTQTSTSILERIRDQVKAAPAPAPANFLIGPNGSRAVYDVSTIASITWRRNELVSSPNTFVDVTGLTVTGVNGPYVITYIDMLKTVVPGAVGKVAYGNFESPNYLVVPGEYMPQVGTLADTPSVQRHDNISFDLDLPAGPKPANGWPVAIIAHGGGGDRHLNLSSFASIMASQGIATIAITAFGYGSSANSKVKLEFTDGTTVDVPDYGRGVDQNGDGRITSIEGSAARATRRWTIGERDPQRQTAIDLLQLVRVIESGVDVDGDGSADLDASKISYVGISAGSMYGTVFLVLEPDVRVAVLDVPGGMSPEHGRVAPGRRAGLGVQLAARTPSLINANGLSQIDGVDVAQPWYNENKPLRDLPIVKNNVAGAIAIQEAFEHHEWGQQTGQSPIPFARYLVSSTLPGVPPKSVIIQANKTDQNAVNPGTTALLRAGGLRDQCIWYRHDVAYQKAVENGTVSTFPKNPHPVQLSVLDPNAIYRAAAVFDQTQAATFIASGGTQIIRPDPADPDLQFHGMSLFEVPIQGDLPETLNYIPSSAPGL